MVDIVITYLNDNSKWREKFNYYKQQEIEQGIIEETKQELDRFLESIFKEKSIFEV